MEKKIVYFERPGKENSRACLEIVKEAVRSGCWKHLVVASTEGDTGALFSGALRDAGLNIVVVTHSAGFKAANTHEMTPGVRRSIEESGAKVYTGTLITHSLETAFAAKFNGLYPTLVVAQSLRIIGEGAKVCCEMAMMAVDAGLIPEGEEILTVAGTGRGADTVLVVRSAASKRFLDLKVLEILAKPRG
ncbi:MAG: pyruvate kinase alpha/beta domain-containing protein [Thermodesulfovibrionales bacterium]